MKLRRRSLLSFAALILSVNVVNGTPTKKGNFLPEEMSPVYTGIWGQIAGLKVIANGGSIRGTYNALALMDYSAVSDHVGGIASFPDGTFAVDQEVSKKDSVLLVSQTSPVTCSFASIGYGNHGGAIQAAGKVVAIPVHSKSGNQVVFVDVRNPLAPKTLNSATIQLGGGDVNAAGIVFDPIRKCHWVIVSYAVDYGVRDAVYLFKSNGGSFFDGTVSFKSSWSLNVYSSQGGTQLLLDDQDNLHVAALYCTEPDGEKGEKTNRPLGEQFVRLSRVNGLDSGGPLSSTVEGERHLATISPWFNPGCSFRWGGTFTQSKTGKLNVVAVARTLSAGPATPYVSLRIWNQ